MQRPNTVTTGATAPAADPPTDTPIAYTVRGFALVINAGIGADGSAATLSERTIRNWCEKRAIPAKKVCGRWIISRNAVDALLSTDRGGLSW